MSGGTLILVTGLATTLHALLAPRESADGSDTVLSAEQLWVSRGLLALVLLVTVTALVRGRLDPSLRALAAAGISFATGPMVSAAFGGHGGLRWNLVFPVLLFGAFLAVPRRPLAELMRPLRIVLRCFVWAGLAALVIAPEWAAPSFHHGEAVSRDYLGLGINQFMGLTPNPNQLAPVAAAALLVELAPVARRRGWQPHALAALASLVLSQSRTGWLCAAAVLLVDGVWEYTRARTQLLTAAAALTAIGTLLFAPTQAALAKAASSSATQLIDVRGQAWRLAYEEFERNPLFGYGPTLFDPAYRLRVFGTTNAWIGQAHNQFLQTLGDSGLLGMVGLLFLLGALTARAWRTRSDSKGLSMALVAVLFAECMTESPLRNLAGLSAHVLLVLTVWVVLAGARETGAGETRENGTRECVD